MNIPEEWGKTRYDDILKEYRIPKIQLFFIITEPDVSKVRFKLRRPLEGIIKIRDRHKMIVGEHKKVYKSKKKL